MFFSPLEWSTYCVIQRVGGLRVVFPFVELALAYLFLATTSAAHPENIRWKWFTSSATPQTRFTYYESTWTSFIILCINRVKNYHPCQVSAKSTKIHFNFVHGHTWWSRWALLTLCSVSTPPPTAGPGLWVHARCWKWIQIIQKLLNQ